jgi:nucleotide-binding universal stress UspA family protein
MSFKTILVHGGADRAAEARVKAAMAVGRMFGAALEVAGAESWVPYPVFSDSSFISPDLVQLERDSLEGRLRDGEAAYKRLCADYGDAHSWRQAAYFPDLYLAELAKGADLVVAGRPGKDDNDAAFANPASVVMQAGAPVLLMPSGAETFECRTVVVAWKDTHEARRALADSLPMLKLAQRVILLQVSPAQTPASHHHGVLERLRRHGVEVVPDFWVGTSLGDGHDLIEAARTHHADLIVAGAYGHSRLREWAFGGVTQTLLKDAPMPVLFSR